MKRRQKISILYCSSFPSHLTQRALIQAGAEYGWVIDSALWDYSTGTVFTGGLPVEGIISHLDAGETQKLSRQYNALPHVTLNAGAADALHMPGSVCDHVAAGRMAAQHLLDLNFRHFAAFSDRPSYDTLQQRQAGFSAAVQRAGFALSVPLIALPYTNQTNLNERLARFSRELLALPKPLAVVAANDRVAVQVINACRLSNLSIPAQVAVCSFDNDPIACDLAPIPISSVDVNHALQASRAAGLLAARLEGKPVGAHPILIKPKGVVIRRSSGIKAQKDAGVARAVTFIHEHALEPDVNMQEIAHAAGVSRSKLFSLFRRDLSCTPLQYLTGLRIDKAKRLLANPRRKVVDIRPQCGFSSDYQMYQAFKRTTGRSPGSFRKARASS